MSFFSLLKGKSGKKAPFCCAVIAAAGFSQRMDGTDKLFIDICGAPVLAHALFAYQDCSYINEIIVVSREECMERVSAICTNYGISKAVGVVKGGSTRLSSVMNGVFAISKHAEFVAIHDGARPCTDQETIIRTIMTAMKHNAAAPAVPVSSTLKRVERGIVKNTVDRADIYEVQTPQVLSADLIKAALTNAHEKSINVTDDCMAAELIGATVRIVDGSYSNIKITTNEDILIAEAILKSRAQELRVLAAGGRHGS